MTTKTMTKQDYKFELQRIQQHIIFCKQERTRLLDKINQLQQEGKNLEIAYHSQNRNCNE